MPSDLPMNNEEKPIPTFGCGDHPSLIPDRGLELSAGHKSINLLAITDAHEEHQTRSTSEDSQPPLTSSRSARQRKPSEKLRNSAMCDRNRRNSPSKGSKEDAQMVEDNASSGSPEEDEGSTYEEGRSSGGKSKNAKNALKKPARGPELAGAKSDFQKMYFTKLDEIQKLQETLKKTRQLRAADRKDWDVTKREKSEVIKEKRKLKELLEVEDRVHQKTIAEYESRLAEQEATIRLAQASINATLRSDSGVPLSDDTIRDKLRSIKSMWRPWAKDWGTSVLLPEYSDRYEEICGPFAQKRFVKEGHHLFSRLSHSRSAPKILLNALLASMVCQKTFGDPFFNITGTAAAAHVKKCCEIHYADFRKRDPTKAHTWRALTLQLYDPRNAGLPAGSSVAQLEVISQGLRRFYEGCARELEVEAAGLLNEVTEKEVKIRHKELIDIFKKAGDLAARLWTQKTFMVFSISNVLQTPFQFNSDIWEPHATMLIDQDDHQYDGMTVDMAIEGTLIAYGDSNGQNYEESKLWMRGTGLFLDDYDVAKRQTERKTTQSVIAPRKSAQQSEPTSPTLNRSPPAKRQKMDVQHEEQNVSSQSSPTIPDSTQQNNYSVSKARPSSSDTDQSNVSHHTRVTDEPQNKASDGASSKGLVASFTKWEPSDQAPQTRDWSDTNPLSRHQPKSPKSLGQDIPGKSSAGTKGGFSEPVADNVKTELAEQSVMPKRISLSSLLLEAGQTKDTADLRKEKEAAAATAAAKNSKGVVETKETNCRRDPDDKNKRRGVEGSDSKRGHTPEHGSEGGVGGCKDKPDTIDLTNDAPES